MGWQDLATPDTDTPDAGGGTAASPYSSDIHAVAHVESRDTASAVSPKGALGTMQTMPGTLRDPGFGVTPARDNSPQEMTRVGREYLTRMQDKYGQVDGLIAYNWGPGNFDKWDRGGRDPAKLPKESHEYVAKVANARGSQAWTSQATPDGAPTPDAPVEAPDDNYSNEGRMHPKAKVDPFALTPVGHVDTAGQLKSIGSRILQGAQGVMDTTKAKIQQNLPQWGEGQNPFPPELQEQQAQDKAQTLTRAVDFDKNKRGKLGMAGKLGEALPGLVGAAALAPVSSALAPSLGFAGPLAGTLADTLTYGAAGAGQKALEGGSASDIAGAGFVEGLSAGTAHAVGGFAQRGLSPFASNEGRLLQAATGDVTPGQLLGGRASTIEGQIGHKLPFSGITMARNSTEAKGARALVNEAIGPTGERVAQGTRAGIPTTEAANRLVSNHYDTHLANASMLPAQTQEVVANTTQRVMADPRLVASGEAQNIQNFVQQEIVPAMERSTTSGPLAPEISPILGPEWKRIDARIGQEMMDAAPGEAREAWMELQRGWREGLTGWNDEAKRGIQQANDAYRRMIPVNRATYSNVRSGGRFNAGDLASAQVASRQGVSPLADAAIELSQRGTHHGDLLGTGAVATLGALTHGASLPASVAAYGASNLAYSPVGRSALTRGLPGVRRLPLSLGRALAVPAAAASSP
jgi:Transglycosylase SLT domain